MVLVCSVDSNPTALIAWFRDDEMLYEEEGGNLTLHINNISYLQDGIYTCVAENSYGKENHSLALSVMCE